MNYANFAASWCQRMTTTAPTVRKYSMLNKLALPVQSSSLPASKKDIFASRLMDTRFKELTEDYVLEMVNDFIDRTIQLGIGCTIDGKFFETATECEVSETHVKYLMRKDAGERLSSMPEVLRKKVLDVYVGALRSTFMKAANDDNFAEFIGLKKRYIKPGGKL